MDPNDTITSEFSIYIITIRSQIDKMQETFAARRVLRAMSSQSPAGRIRGSPLNRGHPGHMTMAQSAH